MSKQVTISYFNYFVVCILLLGCKGPAPTKPEKISDSQPVHLNQETGKRLQGEEELEAFMDNIGQLPTKPLADTAAFYADSVFLNQSRYNKVLSSNEFREIKNATGKGFMGVAAARRIFGSNDIDSNCNRRNIMQVYRKGLIPIVYYPFDRNFEEYAICVGDPEHCRNAQLYFLKKNKIIAKHEGYNRYGLNLNHYKDVDGKTVVYYTYQFTSGSNNWWNNYFFYKYEGDSLIPILNELQNGNVAYTDIRSFWLESFVHGSKPLSLKMVYNVQLPCLDQADTGLTIISDSTIVQYQWNERTKKLEGQYQNSKISRPQVLSYCGGGDDLLFINSYYQVLKRSLADPRKGKALLNYLNMVKNNPAHRN